MKKVNLFIVFFILCSNLIYAQQDEQAAKKAQEIKEITFWGVDYSLARFYGVTDLETRLKDVLKSINNLYISEPDRYNLKKTFKKEVKTDLSVTREKNSAINSDELIIPNYNYSISQDQIKQLIKELQLTENTGTGLIFVGELLDKADQKGSYYVVFFDQGTRDIVFMKHVKTNPGGFGLRNYWAKTIYNLMSEWKYKAQKK